MMPQDNEEARRARARKRVHSIKAFAIHATVFALVNAILIAVNIANGPPWWAQWPFIGWGLGVLGHAIAVYARTPQRLASWEERKIEELIKRDTAS